MGQCPGPSVTLEFEVAFDRVATCYTRALLRLFCLLPAAPIAVVTRQVVYHLCDAQGRWTLIMNAALWGDVDRTPSAERDRLQRDDLDKVSALMIE